MRVVVFGGAGFAGRHLSRRLGELGHRVRIMDARERPELALGDPTDAPEAEWTRGDITNRRDVERALRGADAAVNLASLLPLSRAGRRFRKVNVQGARTLMKACVLGRVHRVVQISSSIVYGKPRRGRPMREEDRCRPIGTYARSKWEAERLCLDAARQGIRVSVIRPRFIVGAGRLGLLTTLFDWISEGRSVYTIGDGTNRFQMLPVSDLVSGIIAALEKGESRVYNLGADPVPTVEALMEALIAHAHSGSTVRHLPKAPSKLALATLHRLHLVPLGAEHYSLAHRDYVLDCTRAREELGWRPRVSTEHALMEAYDWYRRYARAANMTVADRPREGALRVLRRLS